VEGEYLRSTEYDVMQWVVYNDSMGGSHRTYVLLDCMNTHRWSCGKEYGYNVYDLCCGRY
jgi:hypothetical protein